MFRYLVIALSLLVISALVFAIAWFRPGAVRVDGESMRPAIHAGDTCFYVRASKVAIGDVILYQRSGEGSVIHRIVGVEQDSLNTRGDANVIMDREPVGLADVRGRVVFVVPTGWVGRIDCLRQGAKLLNQSHSRL